MAALFHTGQLGIGVGQRHGGGVDVVTEGLKTDIQLGFGQSLLALLRPDGRRHEAVPLGGKAALQAGGDVHGLLGRFNEQSAAAAEGVFHKAVAADTAQVGDGRRQRLADGGLHGVAAVAALVQTVAGGVQHDLADVLAQHEADLILRTGLRQNGGVVFGHQSLDHGLLDDALAGGHTGQLAVQGRTGDGEGRIGREQLLPGDGIYPIEQLIEGGGRVGVQQQHDALNGAQVEVCGCDHLRTALKGQAAVADPDVLRADAAQLEVGRGLAAEEAGRDQFKFCRHLAFLSCAGAQFTKTGPSRLGTGPISSLGSAAAAGARGITAATAVVGLVVQVGHLLFALALEAAHHVLKTHVIGTDGSLGLPYTGCAVAGRASAALTRGTASAAAACTKMTTLAGAARTGTTRARTACRASALTRRARRRRQQALDGQRDLAIRCNVDHLHLDDITIVQNSCNVLHELVGHLGNMDHAYTALRQCDKSAKRLYTGDAALEYVPYLNCQNSILLVFLECACRPAHLPVTSTKMRSLGAA